MILRFIGAIIHFVFKRRITAMGGLYAPVLVSLDGRVLDGNTRIRAAQELGIEIPTVIIPVSTQFIDPDEFVRLGDEGFILASNRQTDERRLDRNEHL